MSYWNSDTKKINYRGDAKNPPIWKRDERYETFKNSLERWMGTQESPDVAILLILSTSFQCHPSIDNLLEKKTNVEVKSLQCAGDKPRKPNIGADNAVIQEYNQQKATWDPLVGVVKLWNWLDNSCEEQTEDQSYRKLLAFLNTRFAPGMSAQEYVTQFETRYTEVSTGGMTMSDTMQATVMLIFANLPEQTNTLIRSNCGTPLDLSKVAMFPMV